MKQNKKPLTAAQIHFYHTFEPRPDGCFYVLQVGIGPGPTLWVKPRDLPFRALRLDKLDDSRGQTTFAHAGHLYLNAHACADTCPDPVLARQFKAYIDDFIDFLQTTVSKTSLN